MADESVHVHIRITSDKKEIAATRRELERLSAAGRTADADFGDLNDTLDDHNDRHKRLQANSRSSSSALNGNGSAASNLGNKLRKTSKDMDFMDKSRKALASGLKTGLKFALIGSTIEMIAMGAAIASVNGLFAIGSASMKVYKFAMTGLAAGIAVGIGALATFAAAQRQYNAAINGFSYKSAPALGASVNQSMAALRNLTSDSRVAVFGMESLNSAFANVSKNANLTKPLQDALAGVGDFAVAAGGDIGKNFAQAAEFVGLLQKEGKLTDDLLGSAEKVGPQFAKALKDSGKTGAAEIMTLLSSGALAESAGVTGALGAVNNTLMGQFKGFFTQMQSRFADLGQTFLPGVTKAFSQIQVIVKTAFTRISGTMSGINSDGFFDGVVKVTEKLTDMFINFFDKYLPQAQTMFSGVGSLFGKLRGFWTDFVKGMESLKGASAIINSAFGTAFKQMFEGFGGSLQMFGKLITDNEPKFVEFGNALAGAFKGVQDFFNGFKEFFVSNLPVISTLIDGLGSLLGLIGKVVGGIASIGKNAGAGPLGSILSLGLVGGAAIGMNALGSKGKLGRAGGLLRRAGGAGSTPATSGPGMSNAATINTRIVYLNTNRVIDRGRSGQTPTPGGGTPPPPTRGQRIKQGAGQHFQNNKGMYKMGGAMLGIAAMSQFANEDANPYLAAGGMLSMINPYAGVAVAGLGTAATSKTIGGGAVSGAIGGAGAGALIGTMIAPGVGTAIGAGIGAAAGATFGAIMAQNNAANDERKVAKGQGQDLIRRGAGADIMSSLLGEADVKAARDRVSALSESNDRAQTVFRQFKETEKALGRADDPGYSNEKIVKEMEKRGVYLTKAEKDTLSNQKRLTSYYKAQQEQTEALIGLEPGFQHFEDQTGRLAGITGTTTKEMANLAGKMGVDLLDPTRTLSQNLKDLGLATVLTGEQIAGVQRKLYAENIEKVFGKAKDIQNATAALDQAAEGVRQGGLGASGADAADFARTLLEQELTLAGGDVTKAIGKIQTGFLGVNNDLKGKAFLDPESPVFGLESIFQKMVEGDEQGRTAMQMLLETISQSLIEINQKTASNTLTAIAGAGLQVAGGDEYGLNTQIQSRLDVLTRAAAGDQNALVDSGIARRDAEGNIIGPTNMTDIAGQQLRGLSGLAGQISQGKVLSEGAYDEQGNLIAGSQQTLKGEELAATLEKLLSSFGINTGMTDIEGKPIGFDLMNQPGEGSASPLDDKTIEAMNAVIKTFGETPPWMNSDNVPGWYATNPAWHTQAPQWYDDTIKVQAIADTSTPRAMGDATSSRLGRTMSRHSYLDSTLPGTRSVTSSFRNFGLGSLKSDHLTGNAYDLTGQNLVGYSNAVNSGGGFAEFHGSGGDRHLHVVPGETPIGDSISSMTPMVSSGGGGGTYSYSINVYPSAGQDATAIAQEVMNRIDEKEKSTRERA